MPKETVGVSRQSRTAGPITPRLDAAAALVLIAGCATVPRASVPDEDGHAEAGGDAAAQANNPLANLKALNFQNYYLPDLAGSDETANQFWLRYAQPLSTPAGDWLVRASLPLNRFPTGVNQSASGLGDANVFATYLFDTGNPALSVGAGPLLGLPTASEDPLGTDQWTAGLAAVLFDARNAAFQWGGLVTYQGKIAGSDRVDATSLLAVQPFGFLQLGGGTYLRTAPIWAFDLESGNYSVPVGLGLGKAVPVGDTVVNFFIEPQYSILAEGPGQPQFQVLAAVNLQFYGG